MIVEVFFFEMLQKSSVKSQSRKSGLKMVTIFKIYCQYVGDHDKQIKTGCVFNESSSPGATQIKVLFGNFMTLF